MSSFSFEIKTARGFYDKLLEEYNDFICNPLSSRHAINCAMNSWHLGEWLFHELPSPEKSKFPKKKDYLAHLKSLCPELQYMQDITNGSKHMIIDLYKPTVKDTELHRGDFSRDFSFDFNLSRLQFFLADGTRKVFDKEIAAVMNFWKTHFP